MESLQTITADPLTICLEAPVCIRGWEGLRLDCRKTQQVPVTL